MRRLLLALLLPLALAACDGIFLKGHASEKGPNDVGIGTRF